MKESRILKTISYIASPILIAAMILSMISIYIDEDTYYNPDKYFSSQAFVGSYMGYLENKVYDLIHDNNEYISVQDGDVNMHFSILERSYYDSLKNRYFLIIYKNKALTNVELTSETSTIESVKSYIENNENSKKVNIIYGEIQAESEIIKNKGIQYLERLSEEYYTTDGGNIEFKTAEAKDFQIYSSYQEEFTENSEIGRANKFREKFKDEFRVIKDYSYFIIPVGTVLLLLILVYLIIATGYKKGIDGIALNDFDKIPLEIILFVAIGLSLIPFIGLCRINKDSSAVLSLVITTYLMIYILISVTLNTIIKRIKAKTFWKTTICGQIILLLASYIERIINKINDGWNDLTYSTNVTAKVLGYTIIIVAIALFILLAFRDSFMTFLLEMVLLGFVLCKIIKMLNGFSRIENKLKEMYEGNNQTELDEKRFSPEFKNTIKYLNDISNGFENAIQDRMKSERMKSELITNVSHDIKTPLTSIINYVDLLGKEDIQNDKAKEYIGILDNKSQRLKKLTEDLVEASKVSTGNIALNLEKINILELIKQAVGEFEDKFQKRGLEAIIDCNENEINIMADSRYMYRIVENLFSNISKYALENSRVYVDIKSARNWHGDLIAKVEIKNISKDKLNITAEELMQRFVRGDKSRTTEGSGLGISIAQNLTELQNGKFALKLDGDLFKVELEFEVI